MGRALWTACCCICVICVYFDLFGPLRDRIAGDSTSYSSSSSSDLSPTAKITRHPMPFGAFAFEVHGRVQGVFFRKFTVAKAQALHLVGWCANTQRGTVVGECQGQPQALEEMKEWLSTEGSPQSHIERCNFKQERSIQQLEFEVFERRKNVP